MAEEWFCEIRGQVQGPLTSHELLRLAKSGVLQPSDIVWKAGVPRGAASRVRGLFEPQPPQPKRQTTLAPHPPAMDPPPIHSFEIPCKFGRRVNGDHDVVSPTPSLLVRSRGASHIEIRRESGDVVTLQLHDLKVLGMTSTSGLSFAGRAKFFSRERPCVQVDAVDLERLLAMMPEGHPVQLAARQTIEGRDFLATLQARKAAVPVVWTITILCICAFVLQLITANGAHVVTGRRSIDLELSPPDLIRQGGDFLPAILGGGWHRLLVSGFLHGGILHLVMNMFALVQIGPFCERLLGSRPFLIIYLVALVGSAWVSAVTHGDSLVSVGASGAIFGVIGIMLAAAARGAVPKVLQRKLFGTAAVFVAYQIFAELEGMARGGSHIDQIAHGAGLSIGFLVGLSGVAPLMNAQAQVSLKRVASVAAGLLFVVFAGGAFFIPSSAMAPRSCLDEAVTLLDESERDAISRFQKSTDTSTKLAIVRSLRNSRNLYVMHQCGWWTGLLLTSGQLQQVPEPALINGALDASKSCPETHAVWLWVRALSELRTGGQSANVDSIIQTVREALKDLEQSNDKDFRYEQLRQIINLFCFVELDHRMAPVTVEAWKLAATDPSLQRESPAFPCHIPAAIALEMVGQPNEAAQALALVDPKRIGDQATLLAALAFYLRGDVVVGKDLVRRAIAAGQIPEDASDFWQEVLALPDAEAVNRVRVMTIPAGGTK